DVNGVKLASEGFDLKGHFSFEGENPKPNPKPRIIAGPLFNLDGRPSTDTMEGGTDTMEGALRFSNVAPGSHFLTMAFLGDLYISSLSYNKQMVTNGKLDVSGAGELDIVLSAGTGKIKGMVRWPMIMLGSPIRPAPVAAVLVSRDGE